MSIRSEELFDYVTYVHFCRKDRVWGMPQLLSEKAHFKTYEKQTWC